MKSTFFVFLWLITAPTSGAVEKSVAASCIAHLHSDLEAYNFKMERSSAQKAAFGALARPGTIVDLGSGSGKSAFDLALLYPDSHIIGVDLDPREMLYAQEHYALPNLEFRLGNAESPDFPDESVDAVFISSTWHHLTSYGTKRFDFSHVEHSISASTRILKYEGLLLGRDFLAPAIDGPSWLDLPIDDGSLYAGISTLDLFLRFTQDFRSADHPNTGVPFERLEGAPEGWQRFKLSLKDRTEFLLRKDYRDTYAAEIHESYLVSNQIGFERAFTKAGLRTLVSTPIYNSWIIENRWRGKVGLFSDKGKPMAFPPTNYAIAGLKINKPEGQRLRPSAMVETDRPLFLRPRALRNRVTKEIQDVIERPNDTVDIIPYFDRDGRIFVYGKQGYPRPITTLSNAQSLTHSKSQGYVVEPIAFIHSSSLPLFAAIEHQLQKRAGIDPEDIRPEGPGTPYSFFPSPGLVSERTTTMAIPLNTRKINNILPGENYSAFSTSGVVKPLEATQVLRSAHIGAILDARLELGVYHLLLNQGRDLGPWIGDEISLSPITVEQQISPFADVLKLNQRDYSVADREQFGKFLRVDQVHFREYRGAAKLHEQMLEVAQPRDYGPALIVALPIYRDQDRVYVGLDVRSSPVAQLHSGVSTLISCPQFRLSPNIQELDSAVAYVRDRLTAEAKVSVRKTWWLGGAYFSSPGVTAETVYPLLVDGTPQPGNTLKWVRLSELLKHRAQLADGPLAVAVLRAGHALGIR